MGVSPSLLTSGKVSDLNDFIGLIFSPIYVAKTEYYWGTALAGSIKATRNRDVP